MSLPASARAPGHALHLLHVLDARDGAEPFLLARAALDIPARHDVILIGNTRDERNAALLGVVTTDRVSPAGGAGRSGAGGGVVAGVGGGVRGGAFLLRLRRLARDRLAAGAAHTPILIAHGPRAAAAARSAVPRRIPMLATLPRAPHSASELQPRLALALEDDVAVTFDPDIAAAWRALDLHDVRVLPVPGSPAPGPSRDELRARLNIDADVLTIITLADPPAAGDARRLASFTGWLYTMDRRAVGLAPRGGRTIEQFRRGVRFTRLHGRRWGMLEVDLPISVLLPACDLAILDTVAPTTVGPALVRAAQAAGVATIVPQAPWLRRLHADPEARETLFAPNATALTVIHRLGHVSETAESLHAARAAALRCARHDDPGRFARELARLIAERLNLPSPAHDPGFIPAAAAGNAGFQPA